MKNQEHDRLLRIKQIVEIIPVSKSAWWLGVKEGRFPQPIKLGPRTTCWRESEIHALITGVHHGDAE